MRQSTLVEHFKRAIDLGFPSTKEYREHYNPASIFAHFKDRNNGYGSIWESFLDAAREYAVTQAAGSYAGTCTHGCGDGCDVSCGPDHNPDPFDISKKELSMDWRDMFNHAINHQKIERKINPCDCQKTIHLETDKPPIFALAADFHLFHIGTDYAQVRNFFEEVLDTDGVYLMLFGDVTQNSHIFKNKLLQQANIFSKPVQDTIVLKILDELIIKNKLLISLPGNHEQFDERNAGVNILKLITQVRNNYNEKKINWVEGIALIDININGGQQLYKYMGMHSSRFNSVLSVTHGPKQQKRYHYQLTDTDVIVSAHIHHFGYEIWRQGKDIHVIRLGSFLTGPEDLYSLRGWELGQIGVGYITMNLNKHELYFSQSLKIAKGIRETL